MDTELPDESVSFELGDRILLLGGRHDGLKGRIYYIDETLIRVLPDGVSDRLIDLSIVDGDIDPELGIESLYSISKRTNPAFVTQIDARVGQQAETFNENGVPGPTYTIKAVSEKTDSVVLEDGTGAELELNFNFVGIPLDEPFDVLRPRQLRVEVPEQFDFGAEELPTEEENGLDVFEDLIEAELDIAEIREIPSSQRYYPDIVQRSDMLQDFISGMDAASQKNPETQKKVRSLVEQCILLRNSLIAYSRSGEPTNQRATSYVTLSELLNFESIPLSRPVLETKRVLYLDNTDTDLMGMMQGNPSQDPTEIPGAEVAIKYLRGTVNDTVSYMETQLGGIETSMLSPDALPTWFLSWETLNKQFGSSWVSSSEMDVMQFREDKEFLRGIPDETPTVDGLARLNADKDTLVTSDLVTKIGPSLLRGLGPRSTRLREKDAPRRVESGEEAGLINTLLFPLSEQASLGAIRSGSIAKDIAHSHGSRQTLAEILDRLEGIPESATAGGILSVGDGGNTMGNIPIDEWLRAQPLYPLGLADATIELANYGLSSVEFNTDQYDVLVEKIQMYMALVKQYITEIRQASAKEISQLQSVPNPFLTDDAAAQLIDTLEGEPLLATRIEDLKRRLPVYKEIDIAIFSALMGTSSDLILTTLAQIPGPLARERNRNVRDQFLMALQQALAKTLKHETAGEAPIPNDCPHVSSYVSIQKIKDVPTRFQMFAKFLTRFQGKRENNWVECGVCQKHLVCYHEVLLLQEFLHPREKDTLHKELLLNFSGGQFHGGYMCKNCGQQISQLEFDTSMEFSDDGTPLIGRGILDTGDDIVDDIIGSQITSETLEFKTETQTTIYQTARKIFDMVGINPTHDSYLRIIQRVEADIIRQPSREEYKRITKGKRAVDYDILLARILVGAAAANCLVEIQTNIPGYVVRSKMPGCRAGFSGFPMGNEKDRTGIEYIACAVAGVQDDIAPWNLTGFQRETDKKRQESALATVTRLMDTLLTNATVQQQISTKRAQLKELYGSVIYSEQLPEQIPNGFLPIPYSAEQTSETTIVPQAASPKQLIRAWVLQAHREGKENGIYIKGNPYSEATCCLEPINEPGSFWKKKKDMVALPAKIPPRGPTRSHLAVAFRPRTNPELEGVISPEIMYKIFLKVCYTGTRMGLPHQPGYTNECVSCGFVYPESPYAPRPIPPMASDKATQKAMSTIYQEEVDAIVTKGKVALETQNIKVDQAAFEEIIDASHKAFHVPEQKLKTPLAGMKLFEQFSLLKPEPFEGWRETIMQTIEGLTRLTPTPDEVEIAEAYGPISNVATQIMEEFKARLGEANTAALQMVLEGDPIQLVEIIQTYFLIPFQRLEVGFHSKSLRVQKSYKLGQGTEDDIHKILDAHLDYMSGLAKRTTGMTLHKMKWAKKRLAEALLLLKTSIRGSYIPGGAIGLPYVTSALIGGILAEFMNPNIVPPGMDTDATLDSGSRAPIQIVDVCIQKLKLEGLKFTQEQIREMINRRDEIERKLYIGKFDKLNPEEKAVELMKKRLGLGDWAVGGTKAIYAYDPEQYERERVQRLDMGFQDFSPAGLDMPEMAEDGYDNRQIAEDDY